MNEYAIMMTVKDSKGNKINNNFYVSGAEAAYEKYEGLTELFPDAETDLVDCETGEILLSTEFETHIEKEAREEAEGFVAMLLYQCLLDNIF